MHGYEFYVDPSRCIGCRACENACSECDTHPGHPMITVEYLDRENSIATVPTVCMHCENPTCAQVCPSDAIKKTPDGVVQSALKPRCVACNNCVIACPFGVPKMKSKFQLMMKCDMCYDRTSAGKRPMCATVCPSQALSYVNPREIGRRRETPVNTFRFGRQTVTTKVFLMAPEPSTEVAVDVVDYMWERKP
ncbi:MAG: 4Fe-4S binding protein [Planctomycetes bacterium]|nr:4Fe-4S binding protein [Planctomycetota bacterium]